MRRKNAADDGVSRDNCRAGANLASNRNDNRACASSNGSSETANRNCELSLWNRKNNDKNTKLEPAAVQLNHSSASCVALGSRHSAGDRAASDRRQHRRCENTNSALKPQFLLTCVAPSADRLLAVDSQQHSLRWSIARLSALRSSCQLWASNRVACSCPLATLELQFP